jgi:hypothetical protein
VPKLKTKAQLRFSKNQLDLDARAQGLANELELYGDLLPYVVYLRRQGWVVYRVGLNYMVGTKVRDHWGLMDVYFRVKERESRALTAQSGEVLDAPRPEGKTPRGTHIGFDSPPRQDSGGVDQGDQGQASRGGDGELIGVGQT